MIAKNLNQKQLEAINYEDGPLLIAAGAGSGKTRTLTSRIIKLIASGTSPDKILALTFTNKAANEMRNRILASQYQIEGRLFIGTFHSLGARILRREARFFERTSQFTIFDNNDSLSLVKKIVKEFDLNKENCKPGILCYKISKIKSNLDWQDEDEIVKKIFKKYERVLIKNNAFDFDDLIEKPVRLFQKQKVVLKKYQKQYQQILVDEFQDINTAQYLLIKLLAQQHGNLSVVGDDAQSIYGWRHADFRNFLNFEKDWPQAKVVLLEENYRSTANIIEAANQVIKNNKLQKKKNLWTTNQAGELIKMVAADNEEEEAAWLVEEIAGLIIKGEKPEKIAVLYRTNAQSRAIEQALIYQEMPYQIFGGVRFYERKEIKDLLAGLRFAFNPKDEISWDRLQKNFSKTKASKLAENLPGLVRKFTIVQLINFIINNTDYFDYLEKNFKNCTERMENVQELINFAAFFAKTAGSPAALSEFLEKVSLAQSQDLPRGKPGINLMTIHLSKGLEFDNVFLSGCSEGILPHQKSYSNNESLEEERRLMYVAMTRARKNLYIFLSHIPSRFLYEIPPQLIKFQSLSVNQPKDYLPDEEETWIEYD